MKLKINVKEISLFRVLIILISFTIFSSYVYFFIAKDYQIFILQPCESEKCFVFEDGEEYSFLVKSGLDVKNCTNEDCLIETCKEGDTNCVNLDCSSKQSKILSGYFCKD